MKVKSESEVTQSLATPWTAAYQAPPSMGFVRQEYWSGVPLPSPDFLIKLVLLFYRLSYGYIRSLSIYVLVVSLKLEALPPVVHVNWRLVLKGLLDSVSIFHKGESQEAHIFWWSHS